jgi:hypothetical protein
MHVKFLFKVFGQVKAIKMNVKLYYRERERNMKLLGIRVEEGINITRGEKYGYAGSDQTIKGY